MKFSNFSMLLVLFIFTVMMHVQAADSLTIKKDYPVSKLSDRIYVIYGPVGPPTKENQGFRNNAIIVITKSGIVVIDPGTSVHVGNMILKKIKSITDKPVVAIFNSHIHGDHWLGNQAFKQANPKVHIYAHTKMIKQAKEGEGKRWIKLFNAATGNAVVGTSPEIPNKTVKDGDVIKIGELKFRVHHTVSAHTDNDIMIEVVEEKAILT